jgi:hypothetical protein
LISATLDVGARGGAYYEPEAIAESHRETAAAAETVSGKDQ